MNRSRPDVVYSNTIASCVGAVAARIAGLPHIWHFREFGFDENGVEFDFDLGLRLSMSLIDRLSAACIANSGAVADAYRPYLPGTELSVVYNSADVPPFGDEVPVDVPWRHAGAIRCVMLGAIQPRKGQEDALSALAELCRLNVPAELLLIGSCSPSYRETIQGMIKELKLTNRVHLHGFCAKPLPLVKTADVLLMCTRREAFGRVTVEAMKLGKPVIGTRSGGTPEIVQPGETGYLYTPGHVKELAARISDLHRNPSDRRRMGANARRSADARFNQEKYGQEVETILRRVVSARSRGADARTQRAA